MGFAASRRYLGCGIVLEGGPLLLKTKRVFPSRKGRALELKRAGQWADRLVRHFRPAVVALVVERKADDDWCRALRDSTAKCVEGHALCAAELGRPELALFLGIGSGTTAAIRGEVARRHPSLHAYAAPTRGSRSESERYWENAMLGIAAAQAALRLDKLACARSDCLQPINTPSTRGKRHTEMGVNH